MFTGIIEQMGLVTKIEEDQDNMHFTIESEIGKELKVDQSIAHNGVCLTVVNIEENQHTVTAIKETLDKSNLSDLEIGSKVNLERCLTLENRIDGHMVQGHVDTTAICKTIVDADGSWVYGFEVDPEHDQLMVEKGSISINGISLTVHDIENGRFHVSIIPYTYEHTNFHMLKPGDKVNIEFDIMGKYITKYLSKLQLQ